MNPSAGSRPVVVPSFGIIKAGRVYKRYLRDLLEERTYRIKSRRLSGKLIHDKQRRAILKEKKNVRDGALALK